MSFVPMVVEACGGGWGAEAVKTWSELAKTSALASGELRSSVLARILGSLSVTLHKENARAVLRRTPASAGSGSLSAAAASLAAPVS